MKSLDLHNSWSQALFVRVSQAQENVVVSGASLHIKNRLVQPSKKKKKGLCFPGTYSR